MATVPTTAELQDQRDHINETLVPSLVASNTVCLILAHIAVALRFLCRRMTRVKYEYDDWLIVAGLVIIPYHSRAPDFPFGAIQLMMWT